MPHTTTCVSCPFSSGSASQNVSNLSLPTKTTFASLCFTMNLTASGPKVSYNGTVRAPQKSAAFMASIHSGLFVA